MNKKLWTTVVGSHVWDMNRPDSDIDEFTVYIVPTTEILSGTNRGGGSHFTSYEEKDEHRHEIGHVIDHLLTGNINYLIGVMSPITTYQRVNHRERLRSIMLEYGQSKSSYHSIKGLAISNYRKYVIGHDTAREYPLEKKCNLICRSLMFGINLLNGNGFQFNPVKKQNEYDVKAKLRLLDIAYKGSKLPDHVDSEPFRNYLLNLRLRELKGEL
jgi:predicted nucleotidyltransferase